MKIACALSKTNMVIPGRTVQNLPENSENVDFASTPVNEAPDLKITNIPTKRISIDKLPPRRLLYETAQTCDNEEVYLSDDSIFGSFDVPNPIQIRTPQSTYVGNSPCG